jgi:hypothetical protein
MKVDPTPAATPAKSTFIFGEPRKIERTPAAPQTKSTSIFGEAEMTA